MKNEEEKHHVFYMRAKNSKNIIITTKNIELIFR